LFYISFYFQGELTYKGGVEVEHFDFATRHKQVYTCTSAADSTTSLKGHGGADYHLTHSFIKAIAVSEFVVLDS